MNVNEIKSWAKKHGYTVKKQGEGYVWWGEGVLPEDPCEIEGVATAVFNKITGNKFVEYQAAYRERVPDNKAAK